MSYDNPRDHGLPNESEPIAAPEVRKVLPNCECPLCKCSGTYGIYVRLSNPEMGECDGYYRGCAACEWASAMIVTPDGDEFPDEQYSNLN